MRCKTVDTFFWAPAEYHFWYYTKQTTAHIWSSTLKYNNDELQCCKLWALFNFWCMVPLLFLFLEPVAPPIQRPCLNEWGDCSQWHCAKLGHTPVTSSSTLHYISSYYKCHLIFWVSVSLKFLTSVLFPPQWTAQKQKTREIPGGLWKDWTLSHFPFLIKILHLFGLFCQYCV